MLWLDPARVHNLLEQMDQKWKAPLTPEFIESFQDGTGSAPRLVDEGEAPDLEVPMLDTSVPLAWKGEVTTAAVEAGVANKYQLQQLESYLNSVQRYLLSTEADGNYLFQAIVQQLYRPGFNASALRKQVCFFMASYPEKVFNKTAVLNIANQFIPGTVVAEGFQVPETFAVCDYIYFMLHDCVWADMIVLRALSLMWGVKTSVLCLNTQTSELNIIRVRHMVPISDVDFVLVYNGEDHFSSTGRKDGCGLGCCKVGKEYKETKVLKRKADVVLID